MSITYYYDKQIKKYITQIMRIFSGIQIFSGFDANGNEQWLTVPCTYGNMSRMVAHIKRLNSENAIFPLPHISIHDSGLQMAHDRRRLPNGVEIDQIWEKQFDKETNSYVYEGGKKYTIEKMVPVAYDMTVTVDVWYTMTDHKLQICEQIMTLFNPDIDIQTNRNPLDWTALTNIRMDGIDWSGASVPAGVDDSIGLTTFTFIVPIYISPPAKLKQQKIINQIIIDINTPSKNSIVSLDNMDNFEYLDPNKITQIFDSSGSSDRLIITEKNHHILLQDGVVTLLGPSLNEIDPNTGDVYSWDELFARYKGQLRDGISLMRLRPVSDIENDSFDYVGRLSRHNDTNKLYWTAELYSIPQDTLGVVDAIIDPMKNLPNKELPPPANGQKYLLTNSIVSQAQSNVWSNISANANDIIEFNGSEWVKIFDSTSGSGVEYITNGFTGKKMKFDPDSKEWIILPDGIWNPGYFRIAL